MTALRYIPKNHNDGLNSKITQVPGNGKCSIALSGGIDSHFLLNVLTEKSNLDFQGICCDFVDSRGEPESMQAHIIAENYDIKFKSVLIDDPLKDLKKLIEIVGEPRYNLYPYYLYKASRKLMWTGDGADEACCGYTFRYKKYLDSISKCRDWKDRVKLYLSGHENDWIPDQEDLFVEKYKFSWDFILEYFKQFFYSDIGLGNVLLADINGKLRHDYIPVGAKLSKAANVDLITPYLDKQVFTDLIRAPIETKYDYKTNTGKILLRKQLDRMNDNHKRGFGFDLVAYYLRKGYDIVHNKLNTNSSLIWEYISKDWYYKHLSDTDIRYVNKFMQLYALELWLELINDEKITVPIGLGNTVKV